MVFIFGVLVFSAHAELDISKFSDHDRYRDVKISPTGKYLAISRFIGGESDLLIVDSKTMKAVNEIRLKGKEEVGGFYWANDERLIIQLFSKKYSKEAPVYYGELFAIDADKRKGKLIFGARLVWHKTKKIKEKRIQESHKAMASSWATIVDLLPNDPEYILISARPYSKSKKKIPRIYKLNIYDADIKFITELPQPYAKVFTNDNGEVLYAMGRGLDAVLTIYSYDKNGNKWNKIRNEEQTSLVTLLMYSHELNSLITINTSEKGTRALKSLDLESGKSTLLYKHPDVDFDWIHISENRKLIYGVSTEVGYPEHHFPGLYPESEAFFKQLVEGFKGYRVKIGNNTKDLNQFVFSISSDREPQAWYLFDRKINKASFIAKRNNRIKSEEMLPVNAFDFQARDGQKLSGYLTLPAGTKTRLLPAVVRVHNGPFGARDKWKYNHEVQLLAATGYAVLQVNYRGSGGYNNRFERAGYGHWGDIIQYDILEGLKFLVDQGIIDPERVCIMGFGFGGYSAVQASVLAPEQFKCAIAASGVYDLNEEYGVGNINGSHHEEDYFKKVAGDNVETLKAFSPINFIEKLLTPVLLVHGEKDTHTSIKQAKLLKDKLIKLNKPHIWMKMKNEGYGMYDEKNRLKYYTQVIEFLDKYNPVNL